MEYRAGGSFQKHERSRGQIAQGDKAWTCYITSLIHLPDVIDCARLINNVSIWRGGMQRSHFCIDDVCSEYVGNFYWTLTEVRRNIFLPYFIYTRLHCLSTLFCDWSLVSVFGSKRDGKKSRIAESDRISILFYVGNLCQIFDGKY